MKRIEEKVKDIVDVRAFANVPDFSADPGATLAGYRFTDITANLMSKWLDAAIGVRPEQGRAVALAGFRGVGKSHFLAVLGAILANPDLRNQIGDQYVSDVAGRLSRRHYTIASVRRGSCLTLLEEIRVAVADLLGIGRDDLGDSLPDLLSRAAAKAGETPLVVLVDTALGRESRVSRDDGAILGELAEAAKSFGVFVGLALDDDIEDADGANLSVSRTYTIDYLDQEHLHKIVDTHIFAKKERSLPLLHDIYKDFSGSLPAFRWSEQRFTSLYPLHPATLEIAPLIRLYLQDFALLGFAAEAGVRILGRPANSLIGLDEVFDAVESKLRLVSDLDDAFAAFDRIDSEIIAKTPVNLRLPAKLILKGLFMLSLDGQGSSALDIAAAMLIFDQGADGRPAFDISGLLKSFAETLPDSISKTTIADGEPKYGFKLSSTDDLTILLDDAVNSVPMTMVHGVLLKQTSEKYSDFFLSGADTGLSLCSVEWRGGLRHGEILWSLGEEHDREKPSHTADWVATITFDKTTSPIVPDESSVQTRVNWQVGELAPQELDAIRRLYVLQTDQTLRESFKEKVGAMTHIQALAVEKIWRRVFLTEGRLIIDGAEYRFTDEARGSHTLSHLFTVMLTPAFEEHLPEHPAFGQVLGMKETAKLIGQFFGGAGQNSSDVQSLVETFALPLGLAELQDDIYVPAAAKALLQLPVVLAGFDGLEFGTEAVIKLTEISSRMKGAPLGLTREAQHLVLAALVSQRQFDFVTFSGNRINQRSLDLQIIWDDIEGIAEPFAEVYSTERLLKWATLITGNSQIKSLERSDDRLVIIDTLSEWLAYWKEAGSLESFESLPDENVNSSIWRTAANLRKTFGALAECIDALVQNVTPLDQCLHNIADLFSDSEVEFENKKKDLTVLKYFIEGAALQNEITTYLALCETTSDPEIEGLRRTLLNKTGAAYFAAEPSLNTDVGELWDEFKQKFIDHYAEKHDTAMNSRVSVEKLSEILRSDRWSVFESFSDLEWFDPHVAAGARTLIRKVRGLGCTADVRQLLRSKPFCSCSFRLARFERRQDQASRLEIIINQGLLFFRARVNENAGELTKRLNDSGNTNLASSLKPWLDGSADAETFSILSSQDIQFLRSTIQRVAANTPDQHKQKRSALEDFRDLLPNEVREWEEEIDNLEVFSNPKS